MSQPHSEGWLQRLPQSAFKLMLLATTMVWGLSFVAMKDILNTFPPAQLVGIRFTIAAALMLAFFHRSIKAFLGRKNLGVGVLLGVLYFIAYLAQTVGLTDTTPGKNAFLTAAYVVMVPFIFWMIARKQPSASNVVAAVICLIGIGFVSLDAALTMGFGDAMTLVCAVFFALHMTFLAFYAKSCDIFTITFVQFFVTGVLALVLGLATEQVPSINQIMQPSALGQMVFLAVVATFLASLGQNVGQTRVPPSQAALILSLESVFGVLASVLLYGEQPTAQMIFGFMLIFIAILLSEGLFSKEWKWRKTT